MPGSGTRHRRVRLLWAAAGMWLATLVHAAHGHAEQPVRAGALVVEPRATCLERASLERQIAAWRGDERAVPSQLHITVRGHARDAHALTIIVAAPRGTRERTFAGLPDDCAAATELVALAIALAIDAATLVEERAAAAIEREARNLVSALLGAGRELVVGLSLGGSLTLERDVSTWLTPRVGALLQASWNQAMRGSAGTVDSWVIAVHPQVCVGGGQGERTRVQLCSGAALGVQLARGEGFASPHRAHGLWSMGSTGLRLAFTAKIPWLVELGLWFPLEVPTLRARGAGGEELERTRKTPAVLLQLGPGLRF